MSSPHDIRNPDTLAPAIGYSHIVIPAKGRTVYFGGMAPQDIEGKPTGGSFVEQFDVALGNLAHALEAAGARPEHLVSMQIYVKDRQAYRDSLEEIGQSWKKHLGKNYPCNALFEVTGFYDEEAMLEIMAIAVIPD